jgi:hypothetical protein
MFQKWNRTVKHFHIIKQLNFALIIGHHESYNTTPNFDSDIIESNNSGDGKLFQSTYMRRNFVYIFMSRYLYSNNNRK